MNQKRTTTVGKRTTSVAFALVATFLFQSMAAWAFNSEACDRCLRSDCDGDYKLCQANCPFIAEGEQQKCPWSCEEKWRSCLDRSADSRCRAWCEVSSQDSGESSSAPTSDRFGVRSGGECIRVAPLKELGWVKGNKTERCQRSNFDGVTNFPDAKYYRDYGGGFCFKGDRQQCLELMQGYSKSN